MSFVFDHQGELVEAARTFGHFRGGPAVPKPGAAITAAATLTHLS